MSFQAFDPPPIPTRIKEADENNASNTSLGKKYLGTYLSARWVIGFLNRGYKFDRVYH